MTGDRTKRPTPRAQTQAEADASRLLSGIRHLGPVIAIVGAIAGQYFAVKSAIQERPTTAEVEKLVTARIASHSLAPHQSISAGLSERLRTLEVLIHSSVQTQIDSLRDEIQRLRNSRRRRR